MAKNMSYDDKLYKSLRKVPFELQDEAKKIWKAAEDAFMRRDYIIGLQLQKQAHSKWAKARSLHDAAAKKIFNIKNANNNKFEIDLHCLLASEAVDYVYQRLLELDKSAHAPQPLLVITGQGKHSKNGPILPAAIKEYFCEKNGYICKDGRPGTFLVSRAG